MANTKKSITFIVEGEPQGKGRHRTTKTGHIFTPEKTMFYENWIKTCYLSRTDKEMLIGPLKASIEAYFHIPISTPKKYIEDMISGKTLHTKKSDADNIAKVVLDSLNGIAYKDDSQVCELYVKKMYSDNPRLEVTIQEL